MQRIIQLWKNTIRKPCTYRGAGWCRDAADARLSASTARQRQMQLANLVGCLCQSRHKWGGGAHGGRWPRHGRHGQGHREVRGVLRRCTWCRWRGRGRWGSVGSPERRAGRRRGQWTHAPAACPSWGGHSTGRRRPRRWPRPTGRRLAAAARRRRASRRDKDSSPEVTAYRVQPTVIQRTRGRFQLYHKSF